METKHLEIKKAILEGATVQTYHKVINDRWVTRQDKPQLDKVLVGDFDDGIIRIDPNCEYAYQLILDIQLSDKQKQYEPCPHAYLEMYQEYVQGGQLLVDTEIGKYSDNWLPQPVIPLNDKASDPLKQFLEIVSSGNPFKINKPITKQKQVWIRLNEITSGQDSRTFGFQGVGLVLPEGIHPGCGTQFKTKGDPQGLFNWHKLDVDLDPAIQVQDTNTNLDIPHTYTAFDINNQSTWPPMHKQPYASLEVIGLNANTGKLYHRGMIFCTNHHRMHPDDKGWFFWKDVYTNNKTKDITHWKYITI